MNTKMTYKHPLGTEIDEPTHSLKITCADDPNGSLHQYVFPDELLERFPITQTLMDSDPDFSLSYTVGLMHVEIKPTYWNG